MHVDVEFVRRNEDADQLVSLPLCRGEQVLFVMVSSKYFGWMYGRRCQGRRYGHGVNGGGKDKE